VIDLDFTFNSLRTLLWQPILGKIGKMTFISQAGVPKWIGIWQFQFKNIQQQYCSCIVCKFDQDRSSNPRDCEGNNYTFLDETAKIGIFHRMSRHIPDPSSLAFQHWQTCMRIIKLTGFAVAQGTLLW